MFAETRKILFFKKSSKLVCMVHRIQMKVSSTKSEMKKILYLSKQDDNKRKMNESGFGSLRLNTIFHFVIFVKKLYLIATFLKIQI